MKAKELEEMIDACIRAYVRQKVITFAAAALAAAILIYLDAATGGIVWRWLRSIIE